MLVMCEYAGKGACKKTSGKCNHEVPHHQITDNEKENCGTTMCYCINKKPICKPLPTPKDIKESIKLAVIELGGSDVES